MLSLLLLLLFFPGTCALNSDNLHHYARELPPRNTHSLTPTLFLFYSIVLSFFSLSTKWCEQFSYPDHSFTVGGGLVSSGSREEDPIMDDNTSTHGLIASAGSDTGGDSGGGGGSGAGIGTDERMGSGVASSAHGFPPGIPLYHPTGANNNMMFPHLHLQLQQYYQNSPMLWDAFRAGIMWAQQSQQQLQHSQQQGGGGYSPVSSHHHQYQHHQQQHHQQQQYQYASYGYGGTTPATLGMIPIPNNHGSGGSMGSPMGAFFMQQPYILSPPTPTTGATSSAGGAGGGGGGDGGTRREESSKYHPNLHQQQSADQKSNNDLQSLQ